jgi:hypothetical protein
VGHKSIYKRGDYKSIKHFSHKERFYLPPERVGDRYRLAVLQKIDFSTAHGGGIGATIHYRLLEVEGNTKGPGQILKRRLLNAGLYSAVKVHLDHSDTGSRARSA